MNRRTVTTTYFYNPTSNKSATVRVRKANFLKSPYLHASQKKGYTFGGRASEKRAEEQPGPGNYEFKSKAVEGPEYSIYGKYPTKYESIPGPGDYDYQLKTNSGCTIGQKFSDYKTDELPGPGAYDSQFAKEGPEYSMYARRDQKMEQTPGPGDYEMLKEQPKGITIGQRQQNERVEDLPGPGNYEQKTYIKEGPHYSIYQKREGKLEQTPGPGDYEQILRENGGVSIGAKLNEKKPEDMPGPGNYEQKSFIKEGPQYSIYQKREGKIEQTPGPGDYEDLKEQKKGVTIGQRLRDRAPEEMPGPGNYEQKSRIVEGPQYSIYQKRDGKIEQTPGPGDYEDLKEQKKGVTIGERLRNKAPEDMPGPGNYEGKSYIVEGPSYSIYQKRDQKVEQTPGPGDYEDLKEDKKGVTIGQRLKDRAPEDMPGPGNYTDKSYLVEGPQYSIYQKREGKIEQTPGPGDYEDMKKESKGVTIGERLRDRAPEELPGPGNYDQKSHIVEGPQYSIYQKRDQKIEQTPGPGDYEDLKEQKKGVTIGERLRDKAPEEMPGPGNYDQKSHIVEGPQYSMYQKRDGKIEQTPGPGDYEDLKEQPKGVTIGGRLKDRAPEDMPGPGNYTEKSYIVEGPKYSIYQKREGKIEQTPGPGDYEDLKEQKKGVTIGERLRDRAPEELPGPGNYEQKSHIVEGPQYSIYQKREGKIEQTPGPGDYEDLKEDKKGVTIGQRLKDRAPEDMPGPGNYTEKSYLVEGPQYSMYQKRDGKIEQTPGPGDYEDLKEQPKGVTIGGRLKDRAPEELPGPGNYEQKSHIIEGPQYSIYQKREGKIEQTPGPGDYEDLKEQKQGVTIGQRLKDKAPEDMPGPGNYERKSHIIEGPQYSIYQKRDHKIEQTPGPGDYEDLKEQPKGVTIGGRLKDRAPEDMPGPGNYTEKSYIVEGPQYSIYQKREGKIEQTPGPGDYEDLKEQKKGVTIGERLKDRAPEDLPGPGNYERKSHIVEGPQYSMYQRRDGKIEQTPGPGDYEDLKEQKKGVTIGERLKDRAPEELPGPGNYEQKSHIVEGPQYSIYQKREGKIEQTPGPGDYEDLKEQKKGVTIGERLRNKAPEDLPGPGNYEDKSYIVEGPKYSIYQKREGKIEQTPGPGDYEDLKEQKKGVTIGERLRDRAQEDMPGPGNYEQKSHIVEGPQYSIYQKREGKIEQTPGPGDYEDLKEQQKGVTIGERLKEKAPEDLPGPGNYERKSHIVEGPQYSMYQRRDGKIEQTPGPGDYEDLKEQKKGVTIGERLKDRAPEDMPGPGNYEDKSHIVEGPQYSIYQRRDQKIEQTPGPGDYEDLKEQKKGVTIGERLKDRAPEELPGPGNYEQKSHIVEGPQYSIYQKREGKIEQTPGPGDYEDLKEQKKGVTIGERLRDRAPEDMPGPGNYEGKSYIKEGPQYSIYQRREGKVEQTPGPGDYEDLKEQPKGVTIGERLKDRAPEELPGPGNYDQKSRLVEGPQYSIYQKREGKVEQTPGPGDYEDLKEQPKGVTIGERLKDRAPEDLPGPGNYERKSHIIEGPQYSMYQRRDGKIEQTPGPGDYEDLKEDKKGVTIGERLKDRAPEDLPGPGNYTEKSYIIEGPQYSIYQKREGKIEQTPGPGDYEDLKEQKKGVTIGERLRERAPEDMPGPGNYEGKSHIVEGPQYSIYQRRDGKIEQTPGPGDYEDLKEQKKGVTIGERLRDRAPEEMPGPGNYDQKSRLIEGPQYSIYQKREGKIEQTPGPGDYEDLKEQKQGVTIGERLKDRAPEDLPGPGNYDQKSRLIEGPQYSIYQKREGKIEQTPGPGDYEDPKQEKKGVTIGERLKDRAPEDLPGPGNYTEKSYIVEGPQYSIYQKRDGKIEQTPGPGDYEDLKEKKEGFTIGQKLKERAPEELPGPGNYEGKSHLIEGPQYSMYQRREGKIDQTPGPGDYEDLKEQPKGVTIGERLKDRAPEELPGPGNYTEKSYLVEGPQYSIYQKREGKIEQTPGPGDYEDLKQQPKGVTIGERLKDRAPEDMPGPGNYEGKSYIKEGPEYSMYQRRDGKIEQTPGRP